MAWYDDVVASFNSQAKLTYSHQVAEFHATVADYVNRYTNQPNPPVFTTKPPQLVVWSWDGMAYQTTLAPPDPTLVGPVLPPPNIIPSSGSIKSLNVGPDPVQAMLGQILTLLNQLLAKFPGGTA